jgi:HPt (histidine-containing phosphotransfer) domain-containing protein
MEAFDRQAVLDRFGGDVALLRQIADLFRASSGPWLAEIREAHAAGDLPRVKRVAHTLKGSVFNFLAVNAAAAARQVQELAANGTTAPLPNAIAHLEAEVAHLLATLDALLTPEMP